MEPSTTLTFFHELTTSAIYMMGASFVLGSAVTLLLLAVLDWIRATNDKKEEK